MTSSDEQGRQDWAGRLSPVDVHHVVFSRVGLGRRGYDELEVDVFLERVEQEMSRLIAEKAELSDEVARLRQQAASSSVPAPLAVKPLSVAPSVRTDAAPATPTDGALTLHEAQRQAVRLLAAAQQTADAYVSDAEAYSRRLTLDARERSERMVAEAREAARRMLQAAEPLAPGAGIEVDPDHQGAYLDTFGQVVRVHLRSYLEALLRDVDVEWVRATQSVAGAPVRVDDEVRQEPRRRTRAVAQVAPEVSVARRDDAGAVAGADVTDTGQPVVPEVPDGDRRPVPGAGLADARGSDTGPLASAAADGHDDDARLVPAEPTADGGPDELVDASDDDLQDVPELPDAPAREPVVEAGEASSSTASGQDARKRKTVKMHTR